MLPAVVFYYHRLNRFSFHPLFGVLEAIPERGPAFFPEDEERLLEAVAEALKAPGRVLVCFSFSSPQMWEALPLAKVVKELCPERLVLVAGGPHPTADPEACFIAGFDLVVRGEGEETFAELYRDLGAGGAGRVRGTCWLEAGKVRDGGGRPAAALDAVPAFGLDRFGPVEITRGCPYACAFCATSSLFGRRPRHRSPENAARWARELSRRGLRDLRVITPNAFSYGSPDGRQVEPDALEALGAAVREALGPGGRLFLGSMPSEVRPDHVTPRTLALVKRYAANDNLVIGAQSGSRRLLEACGRGHGVEEVEASVVATLRAGLKANVDFIFGLPGETEADLDETIALMGRLVAAGARIHGHGYLPLPGTRFSRSPRPRLAPRQKAVLDRLCAAGALFGQWKGQFQQARRLETYLGASEWGADSVE